MAAAAVRATTGVPTKGRCRSASIRAVLASSSASRQRRASAPATSSSVWIEERLDAERTGAVVPASLDAELTRRLDELSARIEALEASRAGRVTSQPSTDGGMVPVEVEGGATDHPRARGEAARRSAPSRPDRMSPSTTR